MKGIKKEYLVLGVIIVASLLFLIFRGKNQVNYQLPRMDSLKGEQVRAIRIQGPEAAEIALQKKGEDWTVGKKEAYRVDDDTIGKVLDSLTGLRITELISRSGDYERYGLNEKKRVRVQALDADSNVLREFYCGKSSSTGRHTYVLLPGDERVYHALGSLKSQFTKSVDDLRDKTVLTYNREEISDLALNYDDTRLALKKTVPQAPSPENPEAEPPATPPSSGAVWKNPEGRAMDSAAVDSLLSATSDLSCSKYLQDEEAKELIGEDRLLYQITLNGDESYELKIYEKKDEEAMQYPAVSSQNDYPFFLSSYKAEEIMKKEKDLLPEKEDEGTEEAR